MGNYPSLVFLTGPTASGKTAVAVELARRCNAEIVNADAYQVYRQLPLLTAAPTGEEQAMVPHHLLGFLDVWENWDATLHYKRAVEVIRDIHGRGRMALIVGGSGLYVKFLSHGLSQAPPASEELRVSWENLPIEELAGRLRELDPEGAAATNLANRRYVTRNLEIVVLGGKPLSYWKQNWSGEPGGPGVYLNRDIPELDERIRLRSLQLLAGGTVEEVASLPPEDQMSVTAGKTLGLSLIRSYIRGGISREECEEQLYLRTRQYAKRQRTWFRRESWLQPLDCTDADSAEALAARVIRKLK